MSSTSVFRVAAAVTAGAGFTGFMGIFVETGFDITVSPWVIPALFVLPFVLVLLLAPRHVRAAAWVMVPFSLAYFLRMAIVIPHLDFGVGLGWTELVAIYVGGVAGAVGFVAAVRSLAARGRVAAH